jgi:four helix bundle protein
MRDYKKLTVWQKSYDFGIHLYTVTRNFPKEETYGLSSQLRRAAISIPSNIAEGSRRSAEKDFPSFLHIAYGSGAELEVQLLFAKDLGYITAEVSKTLLLELSEIMRMLNALIQKIS